MPALSRTVEALRPGVFAELQTRIEAQRQRGATLLPLHIGDTCLAPTDLANPATANADVPLPELCRYGATSGLMALRQAVVARHRARGFAQVDPEHEVFLGVGATHVLSCFARALLDPGDEVLLPSPYWPLAHGLLTATGARVVEVPSSDPERIAAACTSKTKALYLITPNNPDGTVWSRPALTALAELARARDLWLFADEVYADHVFDGQHVSLATLPAAAERTITTYSMSKSHGLAGMRIGWGFGPKAAVAAARRVGVHTVFHPPIAAQHAALRALSDERWVTTATSMYRHARDVAIEALTAEGLAFHKPAGGTYVFVDFREVLGTRPILTLLESMIEQGVLVAPGEAFGTDFTQFARLCFTAVPEAALRDGIQRIGQAVRALSRA